MQDDRSLEDPALYELWSTNDLWARILPADSAMGASMGRAANRLGLALRQAEAWEDEDC